LLVRAMPTGPTTYGRRRCARGLPVYEDSILYRKVGVEEGGRASMARKKYTWLRKPMRAENRIACYAKPIGRA